jgi:hypothetical protein
VFSYVKQVVIADFGVQYRGASVPNGADADAAQSAQAENSLEKMSATKWRRPIVPL